MNTPRPWPKAILFDLDDTLWPIGPTIVAAEQKLFGWLELHAPALARAHTIGSLRAARLALLAAEPAYQLDLLALRRAALRAAFEAAGEDLTKVEAAITLFQAARNLVIPYPDVVPGLAKLGRHTLLGSISNGNADLAVIGLAPHFKVSLAAHQLGVSKPDPAIFHAACAALSVAPSEAVYVGDDLRLDVAGAQNAGLRAVWLKRDAIATATATATATTMAPALAPAVITPDAICTSFDELLGWLHATHQAPPIGFAQGGAERA
jgi:HAD superfamily hydrolase (TIGR01509 family)